MGVIGLERFLRQNKEKFSIRVELRDTYLVIDCNNLQRFLLDRKLNQNYLQADKYGYNFKEYARITRNFFNNLLQCGITPILVVDGSSSGKGDFTGLKESKELLLKLRGQEIIAQVQDLNENPAGSRAFLLPRLHQVVFREIVRKLGIETHQVAYEANNLIVKLANELDCPVLSGDTDFIIFNINKGFILLKTFRCRRRDDCDFIQCYTFKQDLLMAAFPGSTANCLPFLNVLLGKHSNVMKTFDKLIGVIMEQADISEDIKMNHNDQPKRVETLLFWLIGKTREEVLASIFDSIEEEERQQANQFCHKLLNVYNIDRWSNIEYDLEKIYPPNQQVQGREPPSKYLTRLLSANDLNGPCLNIILGHIDHDLSFLSDFSRPLPYKLEFRAFTVAMALLRPKSIDQMKADGSSNDRLFHVYTRKENEDNNPDYGRFEIRAMDHLDGSGSLNHLDSYSMIALPRYKRTRIIAETFRHQAQVKQQLTCLFAE